MFPILGLAVLATVRVGFAAPEYGYGPSTSSVPSPCSHSSSPTPAYGYDDSSDPSSTAALGYAYGDAGTSGTPVPGYGSNTAGMDGTSIPTYTYDAAETSGTPTSADGFIVRVTPVPSIPSTADEVSIASGTSVPAYGSDSSDTLSILPSNHTYAADIPSSSSALDLGDNNAPVTSDIEGTLQTSGSSSSTNRSSSTSGSTCLEPATQFQLSDPPYKNYFYSDCHTAAQVVVTSPQPGDNLTIIGPRLLVAWPAGNSGVVAFFAPENGINGTLSIELENITSGSALGPVYLPPPAGSQYPKVGVFGRMKLNDSAVLTLPILGSVSL